ncbi:EpsI family protein [Luteolibacter algae]|uniref:EpsI family protein n=1 Tax=Luteolibacter algae TaxID=454151 RepID=A0ABW5D458_9BACT
MKAKPLILPALLSAVLASVYFLPTAGEVAQSAIRMELPEGYGVWHFKKTPPSEQELSILAADTEFAKAVCFRIRPGEFDEEGNPIPDRIDLSVVLSGADINNSIHRPERCMPAQGHQILSSSNKVLPLENSHSLEVKRLKSLQRIPTNAEGTEFLELQCVTYYFFVGHDSVTNDHLDRTLTDMKDRLIRGMDQRWAYVSVSMWYGEMPWIKDSILTEEEVDRKLSDFVETFAEKQIRWDQVKG